MMITDVRAVVAIDFGTTFSGFASALIADDHPKVYNDWSQTVNDFTKVPTRVFYKDEEVADWGYAEDLLTSGPECDAVANFFKIHLCRNVQNAPPLPEWLGAETVTTDFMRSMGEVIKNEINSRWSHSPVPIQYPDQVRFVITVPVKWEHEDQEKLLRCLVDADVFPENFENVEVTIESEAAAIYCFSISKQYRLRNGDIYVVVDCGGGTCDATAHQIVNGSKLGEVAASEGTLLGGNSIDEKFIQAIAERLEIDARTMDQLRISRHKTFHHLVHDTFWSVKFGFDGDKSSFRHFSLAKDEYDTIWRHASEEKKNVRELSFDFETVKGFFDEAVNGVVELIRRLVQQCSGRQVKAILLVGGFSASPYLRKRVRETFHGPVPTIVTPENPVEAVMRGAIEYGKNFEQLPGLSIAHSTIIERRVLRKTYGILAVCPTNALFNTNPLIFSVIAQKGATFGNGEFTQIYSAKPNQTRGDVTLYSTLESNVVAPDDPSLKKHDPCIIELDDDSDELSRTRPIEITLEFEPMQKTSAKNLRTGHIYKKTVGSHRNVENAEFVAGSGSLEVSEDCEYEILSVTERTADFETDEEIENTEITDMTI